MTDTTFSFNQVGLGFHNDLLYFNQDQLRFEFNSSVGKESLTVSSICSLSFKHEENHFINEGSSDGTFTGKSVLLWVYFRMSAIMYV